MENYTDRDLKLVTRPAEQGRRARCAGLSRAPRQPLRDPSRAIPGCIRRHARRSQARRRRRAAARAIAGAHPVFSCLTASRRRSPSPARLSLPDREDRIRRWHSIRATASQPGTKPPVARAAPPASTPRPRMCRPPPRPRCPRHAARDQGQYDQSRSPFLLYASAERPRLTINNGRGKLAILHTPHCTDMFVYHVQQKRNMANRAPSPDRPKRDRSPILTHREPRHPRLRPWTRLLN